MKLALQQGHDKVVEVLVAIGGAHVVDVVYEDHNGGTPLHVGAMKGCASGVQAMLTAGAAVDVLVWIACGNTLSFLFQKKKTEDPHPLRGKKGESVCGGGRPLYTYIRIRLYRQTFPSVGPLAP